MILLNKKLSAASSFSIALSVSAALFFILLTGCSAFNSSDIDVGYKIYVPNSTVNVTVIPGKDSTDTDVITLDKVPQQLMRIPNQDVVLALLSGSNEITEINTEDDTITETFKLEVGASFAQSNYRMIFSSDNSKAYISTNYSEAGIAVMKVSDRSFIDGINVDSTSVGHFFLSSDGDDLYAVDYNLGKIYDINTSTDELIHTYEVPETFSIAVYNPGSGNFFLAESGNDVEIKEYNPSSDEIVNRIENVGDNVVKMIVSDDGKTLYALCNDELVLISISSLSIDERVTLDYSSPTDFQFLPDDSYLLIPSSNANLLMVLEPELLNTEEIIDTEENPGEIVILDKVSTDDDEE